MIAAEGRPVFRNSPLNEVAIGIQFAPIRGYQQIMAGEVRALYRAEYPLVEEHQALPPAFEVFGGLRSPSIELGFLAGATHDRFWFLTPTKEELVQFQNDRFFHNWRKLGDPKNQYPRFENIIAKFENEVALLNGYSAAVSGNELIINQCEIIYINTIPAWEIGETQASFWLSFLSTGGQPAETFAVSFTRIINESDGSPIGRIYCQANSGSDPAGRPVINLTLTARGRPSQPNFRAALEFLRGSRDMLLELFAEVTTDSARAVWEREL